MFYNVNPILSYNALLNFIVTERGLGKTFGFKEFSVKDFIRKSNEFVYLRRYSTELDTINQFWEDLQTAGKFDDLSLEVKKSKKLTTFLCDGVKCGYAIPLSTANILKSTAFSRVKNIIFDEFIIDPFGTHRYLKNEVTQFLDIIETIGRLRDIRVFCLGNALSTVNPYFSYFNIEIKKPGISSYNKGLIAVDYVQNSEYRIKKKASRFGQLIANTDYGKYAIDNEWYRDDNSFIAKRSPKAKFCFSVKTASGIWGIWAEGIQTYISVKKDPKCQNILVLKPSEHSEKTILVGYHNNLQFNYLYNSFKNGTLFFENQFIKNDFLKIFNKFA